MASLPDRIARFLSRYIRSVDRLDLLVLLFNSPQTDWTAAAAAADVHCPVDVAQADLDRLLEHGFLTVQHAPERSYRYAPRDAVRKQEVEELAAFYRERPVTVIRRIYEQPPDAVQAFADALKLGPRG